MITYRKAKPTDATAVAKLHNDSLPKTPWSEALYEAEFNDCDKHYYLAVDGDQLLGFGGFAQILDEGHIMNLAVAPAIRRMGVGEKLMFKLIDCAKTLGISVLYLEARCSNSPALSLYRKVGFSSLGVRPGYYEDNEGAEILVKRM